jgi:hypothetical protein
LECFAAFKDQQLARVPDGYHDTTMVHFMSKEASAVPAEHVEENEPNFISAPRLYVHTCVYKTPQHRCIMSSSSF